MNIFQENVFFRFLLLATMVLGISCPGQAKFFHQQINIMEASGIASLPDGSFLIVDDDEGVYLLDENFTARLLLSTREFPELEDLEGITVSGDTAYLLSEENGSIFTCRIEKDAKSVRLGSPQFLGRLENISTRSNKGYEGISMTKIAGKDYLIAVNQAQPAAIAIFSLPELKLHCKQHLPEDLIEYLPNLSDITVTEKGHLLLLSGKSGRVVEVKATIDGSIETLEVIAVFKIGGNLSGKPEGVCVDTRGRLIVVTDGSGYQSDFIRFDN